MWKKLVCILAISIPSTVFAQQPKMVLPIGHTSIVTTAAFSPDARFVVTASWDNTAKVWNVADGKLLFELNGHSATVNSAMFSPNGKYIVTASKDNTAKIWDAANGIFLFELIGHTDEVNTAEYSNDGKYIITSSWDNTAKVWDAVNGSLLYTLSGHKKLLTAASFSRDDKKIMTASWDGTLKIWNAAEANLITELKMPDNAPVESAKFSPDGRHLAVCTPDSTIKIFNAGNGNMEFEIKGLNGLVKSVSYDNEGKYIIAALTDSAAGIWDVASGRLIIELKGHANWLNDARFSNDGKYVVTASSDKTAIIWTRSNGKLLHQLTGHVATTSYAAFSHNGKYIVSVSTDSVARIWDNEDGRLLRQVVHDVNWMCPVAFSPDEKYVAIASFDNSIGLYDLPNMQLQHKFKGHNDWITSVIFDTKGEKIISSSWDSTSKVWSVAGDKLLFNLNRHRDVVDAVLFSTDGKYIATSSWDSTAKLWSALNGKLLYNLKGHRGKVQSLAFSADGKFVITASFDSTAKIWSAVNGKLIRTLRGHSGIVTSIGISPDGKFIATGSTDSTVKIWNMPAGKMFYDLRGYLNVVTHVCFSKNGNIIYTSSRDNTVTAWNLSNGKRIYSMESHSGPLKSFTLSNDERYGLTTAEDNLIKKWEAQSGNILYSFFAVDSTDYLIIDQQGRFDGTLAARNKIYYVCNNELMGLEQFKNLAWEPELAGKINGINKEEITARRILDINICNYVPLIEANGYNGKEYLFKIISRNGGLSNIELYVNNKLIRQYDPSSLERNGNAYSLSVSKSDVEGYFISGDDNHVAVKAMTRDGIIQSRGADYSSPGDNRPRVSPDMYIISVGVAKYKSAQLKLRYTSKDAADFSSVISAAAQKLLNADGKQHVFTYNFVTDSNSINKPFKKDIEIVVDSIIKKARPDDILVAFFAGHGIMQPSQKKFYILTADASGFNVDGIEKEVAISTDELGEWSRKIKANKQVLILDACNSGELINNLQPLVRRGNDIPADQQRSLENLKDKTGVFILSASESGQAANETSLYDQGLLTYGLLSGLKLGGGLAENKFIDVGKWFNYVTDEVKKLAKENGVQQDPQLLGNASFDIGIVDKKIADNIRLSIKKKIFRRSRFINDEELLTDDIDLSGMVDRSLNDMSERGRESPLVFAADNVMDSSYSVHGKYALNGNSVAVKINLIKGYKERVCQFEMSGTIDRKEELSYNIVEKIRNYFRFGGLLK
ncbi:MAG TPA: caspase family protein [Puia sp.]|nr:caspase family protein [Puia sp.]